MIRKHPHLHYSQIKENPRTTLNLLLSASAVVLALIVPQLSFLSAPAEAASDENSSDSRSAVPDKMDMSLRSLVSVLGTSRGTKSASKFTEKQLKEIFGIDKLGPSTTLEVAITTQEGTPVKLLESAGAKVRFRLGDTSYASVPVSALPALSKLKEVKSIGRLSALHQPKLPNLAEMSTTRSINSTTKIGTIDKQGLTGKGVIVCVVDSGIDWRHPDFIRPDGTSRILYLYDLFDTSWKDLGGTVGTRPPAMFDQGGEPTGTLYTNAQINWALTSLKLGGTSLVRSFDKFGHGTACAGMAAGNGRATANGVPEKTYVGVAPEADLIIVKGLETDRSHPLVLHSAKWVMDVAQELGRPCAINVSLGNQFGAHDGSDESDRLLNGLCGPGLPGAAICVAAGNERLDVFHAGTRFGPLIAGQADAEDNFPISFIAETKDALLEGYFDPLDDWRLDIIADHDAFTDEQTGEKSNHLQIINGTPAVAQNQNSAGEKIVTRICKFCDIQLPLQIGTYSLRVSGINENVVSGKCDFYAPLTDAARFGKGGEEKFLVGSPGLAENVITVGAHDDLSEWINSSGIRTRYNLSNGEISNYSCPGYRRDGVVKPDIAAPGTFAISSLARLENGEISELGTYSKFKKYNITQDGWHLAWPGTSVAAPYVTGLTALLLEKNKNLDCKQIKDIICKTAIVDGTTGGVPNRDFGFGKVNPTAAISVCESALASGSDNVYQKDR